MQKKYLQPVTTVQELSPVLPLAYSAQATSGDRNVNITNSNTTGDASEAYGKSRYYEWDNE